MKQAISSCLVGFFLCCPVPTGGQEKADRPTQGEKAARDPQGKSVSQRPEQDPSHEVFRRVSPSVFIVEFLNEEGQSTGISFTAVAAGSHQLATVISPTSWTIQAAAKRRGSLRVRQGPHTWQTAIKYVDPERGLCWLEVEGLDAPSPALRSSHTVKEGERVYFVGAQEDPENITILEGSISRVIWFKGAYVFQTDLDIWMNSQGGGVFDAQGRLVGIAAWFALEGHKWAFASPAEWISPKDGQIVSPPSERAYEIAQWHAVVWREIGFTFFARGDHATASRAYQNAVDCDPGDALLWGLLGSARSLARELEGAIAAFNEAIRLDPSLASAWSGLGDAYMALGQNTKAIEAYETAVKHSPKDFRVWGQMCVAYERLGQVEKAMLACEQANRLESDPANDEAPLRAKIAEANPKNAEAWYELGQAHSRMKRHREAIRAFRRSLDLNPLNEQVWFDLGNACANLKDYVQAIEAYQNAIRLNPLPIYWSSLGESHMESGQWSEAAKAFKEQTNLTPESIFSWYRLGQAYCKQGNTQGVIQIHDQLRTMHQVMADEFFRQVVQKSGSKCQAKKKKSP